MLTSVLVHFWSFPLALRPGFCDAMLLSREGLASRFGITCHCQSGIFRCFLLQLPQSFSRLCAVACCADGCRSQSWEKDLTWGDSIAISACEAGSQWVLALQLFEFMKATNDVCFWAENKVSIAACPWLLSFMHCMNFSWSVRTCCNFILYL